MTPRTEDRRAAQRLDWARAASGDPALQLARASTDAGFRSYWRATGADGATTIVMDSPPDREDVRPWLRVLALLSAGGVRVPTVLARDPEHGFLLLEDLGADTLLQVVDAGNADRHFDAAIAQLLKLQAIPVPDDLPRYDEALLQRELRLFDEWFLGRHLGAVLGAQDVLALEGVYRVLVASALAQPQVLVHRDYMPRNLMPVADGPAVLDFQDAVAGPVAYDPVSLFKDAFLSWPDARVADWLAGYHARALAAGVPVPAALADFRRDADLIGVQRHLKVLGIFARLDHRDAKPKYIADAPRFLAYLDAVVPRYPELAPLAGVLERHVRPALAAAARP
jgi:aminoglycoside/choline kinase family phosphotransferase